MPSREPSTGTPKGAGTQKGAGPQKGAGTQKGPGVVGSLGARLGAAFVGVALVATVIFAAITLATERSNVAGLATAQQQETAGAIASALTNAYRANGGFQGADLQPAVVLAKAAGASLRLLRSDGVVLLASGPRQGPGFTELRRSLSVAGHRVGTLHLSFPQGGLNPADLRLRSALVDAVGVSAGLALLGAIVVAILTSRALVRPIRRLAEAAHSLASGDWGARVARPGAPQAPGELGELGRSFDAMAATLEENEELRRSMVADVAHELRTPLAILQAHTEALVDGVASPTPEALRSLHEETVRLGRLVADLQALASAESAGFEIEQSEVDLADVAASAARSLRETFDRAGVELYESVSVAVVVGDFHRLEQIVTNLLSNAAKFTPRGGRVDLTVRRSGRTAVLEVADTGPGVPPLERQRIFERFFRGSSGRRAGGTGVGLAVVRALVEAHGGEIELADEADEFVGSSDQQPQPARDGGRADDPGRRVRAHGARFVMRLPLANPSDQDEAPPERS